MAELNGQIVQLLDGTGSYEAYPQTVEEAIYDNNGNRLDHKINQIKENLDDIANKFNDFYDLASWHIQSFGMGDKPQKFTMNSDFITYRGLEFFVIAIGQGGASPIVTISNNGNGNMISSDETIVPSGGISRNFTVNPYGGAWGSYFFICPKQINIQTIV